jgi:hypothetical protein
MSTMESSQDRDACECEVTTLSNRRSQAQSDIDVRLGLEKDLHISVPPATWYFLNDVLKAKLQSADSRQLHVTKAPVAHIKGSLL